MITPKRFAILFLLISSIGLALASCAEDACLNTCVSQLQACEDGCSDRCEARCQGIEKPERAERCVNRCMGRDWTYCREEQCWPAYQDCCYVCLDNENS